MCFKSLSKSLELLGKSPSASSFYQNLLSSLVHPKYFKFLSKSLELLGKSPSASSFYPNLLSSLVNPQVLQAFCCHLKVFLFEIGMSRFPIASSFSCSVLSITGDTAKYLEF